MEISNSSQPLFDSNTMFDWTLEMLKIREIELNENLCRKNVLTGIYPNDGEYKVVDNEPTNQHRSYSFKIIGKIKLINDENIRIYF